MNAMIKERNMKSCKQWVKWDWEERDGKKTKVLKTLTGKWASSVNPEDWTDYDSVKGGERYGFVLTKDDWFICVDLDHCVKPNGKPDKWAKTIIKKLKPKFIDRSPSGDGLHLFVIGVLPDNHKKKPQFEGRTVEVYQEKRFVTMPENPMKGTIDDIKGMSEESREWLEALTHRKDVRSEYADVDSGKTVAEVVKQMKSEGNWAKLSDAEVEWKSEEDFAFLNKIADAVGVADAKLICEVYLESDVVRDKVAGRIDYHVDKMLEGHEFGFGFSDGGKPLKVVEPKKVVVTEESEAKRRLNKIIKRFHPKIINGGNAKAYMLNTGYNASSSMFTWVSASGKVREFREAKVSGFFRDIFADGFYDIPQNELGVILAELGYDDIAKYLKDVRLDMMNWVMVEHQFDSIRRHVDPFGTNRVTFEESKMVIETNKVIPRVPLKVEDAEVVRDYKEHFPELDRVLDTILAGRFGADRKEAYLWMRAMSNWGKSFLFVGVMADRLGIVTMLKEKELKKAMTGDPVGIMGDDFVNSWLTVFEEFKGAVSELKDITHSMTFAPKNKPRIEVDLYLKIFLSAESVNSLEGDSGVERQFANRFMKMELTGSLSAREVYARNKRHYLDAIAYYVYQYLLAGAKRYVAMGEADASVEAESVLQAMRADYKMKAVDLMDSVAEARALFFEQVIGLWDDQSLTVSDQFSSRAREVFEYKKGILYCINLGIAKELFVEHSFSRSDQAKLNHKSSSELLGVEGQSKTSTRFKKGSPRPAYILYKESDRA